MRLENKEVYSPLDSATEYAWKGLKVTQIIVTHELTQFKLTI